MTPFFTSNYANYILRNLCNLKVMSIWVPILYVVGQYIDGISVMNNKRWNFNPGTLNYIAIQMRFLVLLAALDFSSSRS